MEDFGEKTEQATPRKREEARKQGQVARSQDLNTAVILLVSMIVFYINGGSMWRGLENFNRRVFENLHSYEVTEKGVMVMFLEWSWEMILLFAPLFVSLVLASFFVNVMQVGFSISTETLTPKLSRLDPIQGLQRIFSMRGLVKTIMSIIKITAVSLVGYWTIHVELHRIMDIMDASVWAILVYSSWLSYLVGIRIAVTLLIFAIIDYTFQRWQHERDLMMTKHEVREELKRMEGDPRIRERRRAVQRQLATQRMMKKVPQADVVITNPTHYAVALQYDGKSMRAPTVVAKGLDHMALKIQDVARANGVPLHEDPPLARALYKKVDIDQQIPEELFQAVAEVLAYVFKSQPFRPGSRNAG